MLENGSTSRIGVDIVSPRKYAVRRRASRVMLWMLVCAGIVGTASSAFAASQTWDGENLLNSWTNGGSQEFVTPSNGKWTNGNDAVFDSAGIAHQTITIGSGVTVHNITFSIAGYTFSSGTLTLTGSSNIIQADANATINAILAGVSFTKTGTGTLTLGGNNTYSGVSVNAGSLVLNHNSALSSTAANLGNTAAVSTNASILLGTTTGLNVATAITVRSGNLGVMTLGGQNTSGTNTFSGNITLNKAVTLTAASGGLVNFSTGTWTSNNNAVTVTGAGTSVIRLSNTLSTTAAVSVSSGTFQVNDVLSGGGSAVTVASGATLGGTGTISKPVTISSGGNYNAGNSPGTLTHGSGLTVAAGGIFNWENNTINTLGTAGTNWDVANVTGGSVSISSTASTGSLLKLLFTDAGTSFSNSFWDTNRSWSFITGGVTAGNLFDTSNITVFINGAQQGTNNTITGQGAFSTAVSGSDLQLLWTATAGNNTQILITSSPDNSSGATGASDKTIAFGRVLVGGSQTTASQTITKTGTDATTYTVTPAGDVTSTTFASASFSTTNPVSTSGTITLDTSTVGSKSGTVTIDNTSGSSSGGGLGSADADDVFTVTATAVNQRTFSVGTSPIALGRFVVGTTPTGTSAISSSGLNAVTANATLGGFVGTNTGSLTLTTGDSTVFNGGVATQTANYTIGGSVAAVGPLSSASFSAPVAAELGSIGNVVVGVTGTAVNQRTITNPATVTFSLNLLKGAPVSGTGTFTTSGLHAVTTDATVAAATGVADANGVTLTGAANSFLGLAASENASRTLGGKVNTYGTNSGSFNLIVTGEGVTGEAAYSDVVIAYTASGVGQAVADKSNSAAAVGTALHALIANGGSYEGLESTPTSTTGSGGAAMLGSTATILAGTNTSGSTQDVSMAWRTRTTGETGLLASDVVDVSGFTGIYVLQMTYTTDLAVSSANGKGPNNFFESTFKLGWLSDDGWSNAVDGNTGSGVNAGIYYQSWTSFFATHPILADDLGAYGVDVTTNTAWAVLDHNSQFAVIPAPSALPGGLMLMSLLGLTARRSRQR